MYLWVLTTVRQIRFGLLRIYNHQRLSENWRENLWVFLHHFRAPLRRKIPSLGSTALLRGSPVLHETDFAFVEKMTAWLFLHLKIRCWDYPSLKDLHGESNTYCASHSESDFEQTELQQLHVQISLCPHNAHSINFWNVRILTSNNVTQNDVSKDTKWSEKKTTICATDHRNEDKLHLTSAIRNPTRRSNGCNTERERNTTTMQIENNE